MFSSKLTEPKSNEILYQIPTRLFRRRQPRHLPPLAPIRCCLSPIPRHLFPHQTPPAPSRRLPRRQIRHRPARIIPPKTLIHQRKPTNPRTRYVVLFVTANYTREATDGIVWQCTTDDSTKEYKPLTHNALI